MVFPSGYRLGARNTWKGKRKGIENLGEGQCQSPTSFTLKKGFNTKSLV